eukprot:6197231-Pleurochrysis_carterae.AAC.2
MAYLIWKQRATAEEAFAQLRAARAVCDPNFGFRVALKEWESQARARIPLENFKAALRVDSELSEREQPAKQKQRIGQACASPQSQLRDLTYGIRGSGSDDGFLPP